MFSACRRLNRDINLVTSEYVYPHVQTLYNLVSCVCGFSALLELLTMTLIRSLVAGSVFSGTDCRP